MEFLLDVHTVVCILIEFVLHVHTVVCIWLLGFEEYFLVQINQLFNIVSVQVRGVYPVCKAVPPTFT